MEFFWGGCGGCQSLKTGAEVAIWPVGGSLGRTLGTTPVKGRGRKDWAEGDSQQFALAMPANPTGALGLGWPLRDVLP